MIHSLFNDCVLPSPQTDCNVGITFIVIRDWAYSTVKTKFPRSVEAGYRQKLGQTLKCVACVQLVLCKVYELHSHSVKGLGSGTAQWRSHLSHLNKRTITAVTSLSFMKIQIHTSKANHLIHHNHQAESCKSTPAYDINGQTKYWQTNKDIICLQDEKLLKESYL